MNVWADGLSILVNEWRLVVAILVCVFAGQALIRWLLERTLGGRLTPAEAQSLGLAGWTVPFFLLSLIWYWTGFDALFWILPAGLILSLLFRLKTDSKPALSPTSLLLILFLFASILLRLAYASRVAFPLYFDSAQHYSVIQGILAGEGSGRFAFSLASYYHQGFHFLSAFIASVTQAGIARVMLVLGQVILALIPFPVFFLARYAAKSDAAGWFALILSAFGWYMPAHAVDWGKYPALTSLGMISFVLCLAYLLFQQINEFSVKKRWILYGMFGISAIATIFMHSRSLVILGIVFLAWTIVTRLEKLPRRAMALAFILIVVVAIVQAVFILRQNILVLLFDPYLFKGVPVTALAILLSIFAWLAYTRFTFVSVLAVNLLLACLFVPVTIIPGYRDLTLLDRPFVEMILYLPLSLLGGLGLAGLEEKLRERFAWGRVAGWLVVGFVAVNALFTYDLYPSDCCVIVGNDDVAAMDWMADQLPVDARIGIASTTLKVMPTEASEGDVGADAGIWVTPLTGRTTIPLPNTSAFDQEVTLKSICELGLGYLFVGEAGQPFDAMKILSRPEWYRPLLSMPKTGVYEVIGCE